MINANILLNNNYKYIVEILKAYIKNEPITITDVDEDDFIKTFDIARDHFIDHIIFSQIKRLKLINSDSNIIIAKKNSYLMNAFKNQEFYSSTKKLYVSLSAANIECLILKGLSISRLYHNEIDRKVSDNDIFIFNKVHLDYFIKENGYQEYSFTKVHKTIIDPFNNRLEVHVKLASEYGIRNLDKFTERIWGRKIESEYGKSVYYMEKNDEVIYVILHMASHVYKSGFGLRQLLDLSLLLNQKNIDYELILHYLDYLGIYNIGTTIITLCKELFEVNFPLNNLVDQELLNIFLGMIFDSGVYGKNEKFLNDKIYFHSIQKLTKNKADLIITLFFKPLRIMKEKYAYLNRYPFLLPYAWLDRVISSIKDGTLKRMMNSEIDLEFINNNIRLMNFFNER